MKSASAYLDDAHTMPRPARHVHLYLAAIDGVIVVPVANRRPADGDVRAPIGIQKRNSGSGLQSRNRNHGVRSTIVPTASMAALRDGLDVSHNIFIIINNLNYYGLSH